MFLNHTTTIQLSFSILCFDNVLSSETIFYRAMSLMHKKTDKREKNVFEQYIFLDSFLITSSSTINAF